MNAIISYNNVTAEFQQINPVIAKTYLEKNIKNRKIDRNRVDKYVNDMKNGYWCMNGDAIRFDINGTLIDGQHRLESIVKSGITQTFLIIKNVQQESKRTIDTGKNRTGSDILSMFSNVGTRDSGVISSAITKLICYEKLIGLNTAGHNSMHYTLSAIEEYYKQNYLELHKSLEFINSAIENNALVLSRSECLFLHVIFSRINAIESNFFMKKILTGINVQENSNEMLIRSILTKRAFKTLKIKSSDLLYTIIKAWNRNRKGGVYSSEGNIRYSLRDSGYPIAV